MNRYISIFTASFLALSIQILLTRVLSVVYGYQLAFFCISLAMLGITVGSVYVYMIRERLKSNFDLVIQNNFSYLGFSVIASMLILAHSDASKSGILLILLLGISTIILFLPFFFSGVIISAILSVSSDRIAKVYFSDLLGASIGCIFVVLISKFIPVPTLILLLGILAFLYPTIKKDKWYSDKKNLILYAAALLIILFGSHKNSPFILNYVKGLKVNRNNIAIEQWNSFSHISMLKPSRLEGVPGPMWGHSSKTPDNLRNGLIHYLAIDGEAGTGIVQFNELEDLEYLKYDLVNIGHTISQKKQACIIGVGSGRDIHSAILYGYEKILAVEINPIFVDIINNQNRDEAKIAQNPNITLVVDEGRAYYSKNKPKCNLLMMSLIDTWASTGTGAMTLTENNLYTIEAWKIFLEKISDDGIFTVSRWYNPEHPEETGKMFTLAISSLFSERDEDVSEKIILIGNRNLATILLKNKPFTAEQIESIQKEVERLDYKILYSPKSEESLSLFKKLIEAKNNKQLDEITSSLIYNLTPPRDDNPYFFNLLNLSSYLELRNISERSTGVLVGNIKALNFIITLLIIVITLSVILAVLPLYFSKIERPGILQFLYFFCIGAGFILVEIGLIQRFSLVMGRPEYSLGLVLAGIILALGIGSYLSGSFIQKYLNKTNIFIWILLSLLTIFTSSWLINSTTTSLVTFEIFQKSMALLALILPVGIILGFGFPLGIKIIAKEKESLIPWLWSINGVAGVLFSILGTLISMYLGIQYTIYISIFFYTLAGFILIFSFK